MEPKITSNRIANIKTFWYHRMAWHGPARYPILCTSYLSLLQVTLSLREVSMLSRDGRGGFLGHSRVTNFLAIMKCRKSFAGCHHRHVMKCRVADVHLSADLFGSECQSRFSTCLWSRWKKFFSAPRIIWYWVEPKGELNPFAFLITDGALFKIFSLIHFTSEFLFKKV